ncbi:MAG TPA: hypothetical protein VK473_00840 [Terriglobales bacterium]|nr:hypothetical protein [Terriglobales bacterium]
MVFRNFYKSLAAVLIGNAIYFLILMPVLPPAARHGVSLGVPRIDLGLVIDFWVCVVVYGVIELFLKRRATRSALRK